MIEGWIIFLEYTLKKYIKFSMQFGFILKLLITLKRCYWRSGNHVALDKIRYIERANIDLIHLIDIKKLLQELINLSSVNIWGKQTWHSLHMKSPWEWNMKRKICCCCWYTRLKDNIRQWIILPSSHHTSNHTSTNVYY